MLILPLRKCCFDEHTNARWNIQGIFTDLMTPPDKGELVFSAKSEMWTDLSRGKRPSDNFLDPAHGAINGMGQGVMSDGEYLQKFQDWTERYSRRFTAEELSAYPEPLIGRPKIVEYNGYRASIPYIKNFALAKFLADIVQNGSRIMEIGAGYGGMAEIFMRMRPVAEYAIVDLPEVLPLSHYFLTSTHPNAKLKFVEADKLDLVKERYDVILNFSSFGEMPRATAQAYVKWSMDHLTPNGRLVSFNSYARTPSGVQRYSDYGFHHHHVSAIYAQPDVAGAFHDQHLVLIVKNGAPTFTADHLNRAAFYVSIGLHDDLDSGNTEAMELMAEAVMAHLFRRSLFREYLQIGHSVLARGFAGFLTGQRPDGTPDYLWREIVQAGKRRIWRRFGKARSAM